MSDNASRLVFRWLPKNQEELRDKHYNRGRDIGLQAYIDQIHIDYIGTRDGTKIDNNFNHGLFGTFINDDGSLEEIENLPLEKIEKKARKISKKGIDIYKTVFSLREDDAINLRYR